MSGETGKNEAAINPPDGEIVQQGANVEVTKIVAVSTTKPGMRERSIRAAHLDRNHGVTWIWDDGGRHAAGHKGLAGDCVARALAIASGRPYQEVYDRLAEGNANQRTSKHDKPNHPRLKAKTASHGILTGRKWFKDYMAELGAKWVPTMTIGSGCQVHLHVDELPKGRLVLKLSRHFCAFIDGVIHDCYDSSREGTRCVYGYWQFEGGDK